MSQIALPATTPTTESGSRNPECDHHNSIAADNAWSDMNIYASDYYVCTHNVTNVTGSGGRQIMFLNGRTSRQSQPLAADTLRRRQLKHRQRDCLRIRHKQRCRIGDHFRTNISNLNASTAAYSSLPQTQYLHQCIRGQLFTDSSVLDNGVATERLHKHICSGQQ